MFSPQKAHLKDFNFNLKLIKRVEAPLWLVVLIANKRNILFIKNIYIIYNLDHEFFRELQYVPDCELGFLMFHKSCLKNMLNTLIYTFILFELPLNRKHMFHLRRNRIQDPKEDKWRKMENNVYLLEWNLQRKWPRPWHGWTSSSGRQWKISETRACAVHGKVIRSMD